MSGPRSLRPRGFRRVLVANRGEIAARVIRTCRRLGIETVLAASDADLQAVPARLADMVIRIGPAPAAASYLNTGAIVAAARAARADAVHPGYGFLSENARLARACAAAGIAFIGPAPETLEAAGDKLAARSRAIAAGLPVLPGGLVSPHDPAPRGNASPGREPAPVPRDAGRGAAAASAVSTVTRPGPGATPDPGLTPERESVTPGIEPAGDGTICGTAGSGTAGSGTAGDGTAGSVPAGTPAAELAALIGFPVLVKAAGGGGGRGLRVVRDAAELAHAVAVAGAEADAAFGDPRVYLERYVSPARHVEVQILGDGVRVIHLGDRDCSVQRRYQKLIEEAPAPGLPGPLRDELHRAAAALGRHLAYRGAGTVEFLVDVARGAFYFLEVNARIQVEHPVTEAVTGLDLVAEQIAIAEGRPLRMAQDDVTFTGHAIECRINAEDPANDFLPSPGTITRAVFPASAPRHAARPAQTASAPGTSGKPDASGGPGASPPPAAVPAAIRVDTHIQPGSAVPPNYDSLLAKVIAHGGDRAGALAVLRGALDRCEIDGVTTNLAMHRAILDSAEFRRGGVDAGYLERRPREAPAITGPSAASGPAPGSRAAPPPGTAPPETPPPETETETETGTGGRAGTGARRD